MSIVRFDEDGNREEISWARAEADDRERRAAALKGEVSWGPWRYNPTNSCLECENGPEIYQVDLEECRTSAETLDWIMQIANKTWADDATLSGLTRAINELLKPQTMMCSGGNEGGPVDIKGLLSTST